MFWANDVPLKYTFIVTTDPLPSGLRVLFMGPDKMGVIQCLDVSVADDECAECTATRIVVAKVITHYFARTIYPGHSTSRQSTHPFARRPTPHPKTATVAIVGSGDRRIFIPLTSNGLVIENESP
jgi:hypothetical protein